MQTTLLGAVTANMRSVLVFWSEREIRVRIVFTEAPSSTETELASELESEMMSHFPGFKVACVTEVSAPKEKIQARSGEVFVFQRWAG